MGGELTILICNGYQSIYIEETTLAKFYQQIIETSTHPQKPPAEQHWPLKGPLAQVYPPLLAPQSPLRVGTFAVRQALENDF
jgi:hypothetical protein